MKRRILLILAALFNSLLLTAASSAQQLGDGIAKKDYRAIEESIAPNVLKEIASYSLFEKQTKHLARKDVFASVFPHFQREEIQSAFVNTSLKKPIFTDEQRGERLNRYPTEIMLSKEAIVRQSKKYLPSKQKVFFE